MMEPKEAGGWMWRCRRWRRRRPVTAKTLEGGSSRDGGGGGVRRLQRLAAFGNCGERQLFSTVETGGVQ
ncbi:unnamed protein product [Cuscuta epithymum]|uniref:Uncharacterized protein n=1 Tax=Cuscuta epithymum TaxID=186058 RepID=A0AAV0CBF5_9ASTE|nr:unnamed protein product [Cuscuta epithymum]